MSLQTIRRWTTRDVVKAVDPTYRQIDYWIRTVPELSEYNPSLAGGGSGVKRQWRTDDLVALQTVYLVNRARGVSSFQSAPHHDPNVTGHVVRAVHAKLAASRERGESPPRLPDWLCYSHDFCGTGLPGVFMSNTFDQFETMLWSTNASGLVVCLRGDPKLQELYQFVSILDVVEA